MDIFVKNVDIAIHRQERTNPEHAANALILNLLQPTLFFIK